MRTCPRSRPVSSSTAVRTPRAPASAARACGSTAAPASVNVTAAPAAVEQLDAELTLQPPHLRAHAGLRDQHPLGRAREAAFLDDRHEVLQLPQLHTQRC